MTHGHNMLLGYKGKMVMGSCVLSDPLNTRQENAFTLQALSAALCEELFTSDPFLFIGAGART